MPAGDVFGLDGFFLNKSNPVVVSTIGINSTGSSAGIAITGGSFTAGTVTLNLSNAAGLSTTPFYTGAKIAVSGLSTASGVAHTGYNGNFVVTGFAGTTTVSYATTGYIGPVNASIAGQTGLVVLLTDTQVTNTTWSSAQTHGWFAGGGAPVISRVDRIDFSNDSVTANIRGPLGAAKYVLAATGNSNYGWFGGGLTITPIMVSSVDRIDFSNDSSAVSVRGPLSFARQLMAAAGNSNYGFFGGGANFPATVSYSTVNRIDFSNDSSTASLRGPLSGIRYTPGATGNSNYSWFGGGNDVAAATRSTVDRIDFSNDSVTASPRGSLSLARNSLAATGNSNYGWFGGGNATFPAGAGSQRSTVNRIDFSNDSPTASIRGPLSLARYALSATGNSNYGWFGGGASLPAGTQYDVVDRIDFSNDSSTASPRGTLSSPRNSMAATGNSNYGWFGGGGQPLVSTVDRIDFSNDLATVSPRGPLNAPAGNQSLAATGNSNYGWFGGGSPGPVSTVDRINFSNDSVTSTPRGPLSTARSSLAATGNSNYGWFGGGATVTIPVARVSTVDRINFSNDSVTASIRGSLTTATGRTSLAATSNTPT